MRWSRSAPPRPSRAPATSAASSTCARRCVRVARTCEVWPKACLRISAMEAVEPLRLIDSHCHLEAKDFTAPDGSDERPAILARARQAGVEAFVCVGSGSGLHEVQTAVSFAAAHRDIWAAVGIHPHDA